MGNLKNPLLFLLLVVRLSVNNYFEPSGVSDPGWFSRCGMDLVNIAVLNITDKVVEFDHKRKAVEVVPA